MFHTVVFLCFFRVVLFIHGTYQVAGDAADSFKADIFAYGGLFLHCGHNSLSFCILNQSFSFGQIFV